jgi:sugar phosphate isomerase/epimerase
MLLEPGLDLTYCTNIHPGSGWKEVFANIQCYAPGLKQRLSPGAPFGLGLRLSNEESRELAEPAALDEFAGWLAENGLYVSLINGFPFGSFHREKVKDEVFAPDWRIGARLEYTVRLARILARLLPEGGDGGVSTIPLSYKRWGTLEGAVGWREIARNLATAVAALAIIRRDENRTIHIDIEPEPDGLVENSAELVRFFEDVLLPEGAPVLAAALICSADEAVEALRRHVQVCFDTCHSAVEYESVVDALQRYANAGMGIGRIQISSALHIHLDGDREAVARELGPFADSTYLHQVIERRIDGSHRQYADLPEALPNVADERAHEWRIHFHVPVFVESYGRFASTQPQIRAALDAQKRNRSTSHLEIETYTWEVLPPALKQDLEEMIGREFEWVLNAWR